MKHYSEIAIWGTKKRIQLLIKFRTNVAGYFEATSVSPTFDEQHDTDASLAIRPRINLAMHTAKSAIDCAGIGTQHTYRAPPVVGGYRETIDLILNVFQLDQFQIPPSTVIGLIEQAIGVYMDDHAAAWRRTLNPFWWIGRFLTWLAHLPFLLLETAGFNAKKAERSLVGKLVSLFIAAIPVAAGLLVILDLLGFLEAIKSFFSNG